MMTIIASMPIFTSDRERRLWLWTLVVLAAIYSTLGPAATLVAYLRERNLLRVSSTVILLIVIGVIVWQWVKRRPSLSEIGVALGIAAVYLMAWIRIPIPEERTHLIEYSIVAILIYQALSERQRNGRKVPAPAALAVGITALLGLVDETIQTILPNRVFDIIDVGFNAGAGLMAILGIIALAWARRRGDQILRTSGLLPRKD
ncbi:MAG: VanZ family protein [Chloroflexota bacterium]|nr:MAG: VanZ family protein [Chloroflexota bacterium]